MKKYMQSFEQVFCSGYDFAIAISLPQRLMNIHANAMTISICEMDIENVRFKKSVKLNKFSTNESLSFSFSKVYFMKIHSITI